jgi:hypothetical protein
MRLPARRSPATAPPPSGPECRLGRHREFIRALPCVACGKPAPSECAELRGAEPGDPLMVPLCGPATVWQDCCHSRLHDLGLRFWSALGIDPLDLACRLWRVSGDIPAGEPLVRRARQRIARQRQRGEARR